MVLGGVGCGLVSLACTPGQIGQWQLVDWYTDLKFWFFDWPYYEIEWVALSFVKPHRLLLKSATIIIIIVVCTDLRMNNYITIINFLNHCSFVESNPEWFWQAIPDWNMEHRCPPLLYWDRGFTDHHLYHDDMENQIVACSGGLLPKIVGSL